MSARSRAYGFDQAAKILKQLPDRVGDRVLTQATRAGAGVIRKAARANLRPRRRTGTLAKSVAAVKRRRGVPRGVVRFTVGGRADGFYGNFLEFGTAHHAARPWLRPAYDANKAAAIAAIRSKLGAAILKEAQKLAGRYRTSGLARRRRR